MPVRIVAAVLLTALLASCGDDKPEQVTSRATATATPSQAAEDPCLVAGRAAPALVAVPRGGDRPAPLLIAFHGLGDTARNFEVSISLDQVATDRGMVVAWQDAAHNREWQVNAAAGDEDVATTRKIIDGLVDAGCADPARVYLTGFSNGGAYTARAGCDLAGKVAAIAPVAGAYGDIDDCPPKGPHVPLLELHGDRDPWFDTVGKLMDAWLARDDCPDESERTHIQGVTTERWPSCDVQRVTLGGTGHAWFGEFSVTGKDPTGFEASPAVVDFVLAHHR